MGDGVMRAPWCCLARRGGRVSRRVPGCLRVRVIRPVRALPGTTSCGEENRTTHCADFIWPCETRRSEQTKEAPRCQRRFRQGDLTANPAARGGPFAECPVDGSFDMSAAAAINRTEAPRNSAGDFSSRQVCGVGRTKGQRNIWLPLLIARQWQSRIYACSGRNGDRLRVGRLTGRLLRSLPGAPCLQSTAPQS